MQCSGDQDCCPCEYLHVKDATGGTLWARARRARLPRGGDRWARARAETRGMGSGLETTLPRLVIAVGRVRQAAN